MIEKTTSRAKAAFIHYKAPDSITDEELAEYLSEHPEITTLDLSNCGNLTQLPEQLPPNLLGLNLRRATRLTHLPQQLPPNLEHLDLQDCNSLKELPALLPPRLLNLDLHGCVELTHLPQQLPSSLLKLGLSGCHSLLHLPQELPPRLTELNLALCRSLTQLPALLPKELYSLYLSRCYSLTDLPEQLPPMLWALDLFGCSALTHLPDQLPATLSTLNLKGCSRLTHLPERLPPRLQGLDLFGCYSLTELPKQFPPGFQSLHLGECRSLQHLPALPGHVLVHLANNWMLLTFDEQLPLCSRSDRDLNGLPHRVPAEFVSQTDAKYPSYVLAVRLAWQQAVNDTLADLSQQEVEEDEALASIQADHSRPNLRVWLESLLELHMWPRSWTQGPSARVQQQEIRSRFEHSLARLLALPRTELLRMGGSAQVAVATLYGQTLSRQQQAVLALAVEKFGHFLSPEDQVALVIGLKAAAFRDAFLELAKPPEGTGASADAALRLTLTFGRSWKNWLTSRASTLRESAADPTFAHDASFWLPVEPVNKLRGLADWLFQPQHRGKPATELGVIAKHWSSLTPEERQQPYLELRELVCTRKYPGARNAQLALEAGTWGTESSDYAEIEDRFTASLAVPSPFPLQSRWSQEELSGRFLPRDDVRGLFLGQHTNCCQHPDGAGSTAAWYGQEKPNAGFFVVEDKYGQVVAQSMAWIARHGKGLVFDSAECQRLGTREAAVVAIYTQAADELSHTFGLVTLGIGTDKLKANGRWPAAADWTLPLPKGDTPYTDSGSQVLLAVAADLSPAGKKQEQR